MFIFQTRAEGLWGAAGLILGAALSATVVSALGHSASTLPLSSPDRLQTDFSFRKADPTFPLPLSIVLPVVRNEEIEEAIKYFPVRKQTSVREEAIKGTHRLLWLTVWDWDTADGEPGNTISILSDTDRRIFKLTSHRIRIA